ncbi:MAG: flagellar protein FlgN [Firmicutes bacterium]|nr:flagellar protein FlgN [Bacillota bacterium]
MHTAELARLAEILAAQDGLCRRLLACARRQQEAIRSRRPPVIEETAREQEQLFGELTRWEEERVALTGAGGPSLSEIVAGAPSPWRERLESLGRKVREGIEAFLAANRTNQRLLEQELALIDMYLSVLSPGPDAGAYGHPASARRPGASAPRAFDARA